jgi:hypothetical protein
VTARHGGALAAGVGALCLAVASGPAAGSAVERTGAAPKAQRAGIAPTAQRTGAKRAGRTGWRRCRRVARPRRAPRCAVFGRRMVRTSLAERLVPGRPASPAPGGGGSETPAGGSDGGPGTAPSLARFVSVAAREWSLTLSRPIVGAGAVTVELRNLGEDPHNLIVSPDDGIRLALAIWPDADPGTTMRQGVELGAGDYRLWCSLEGHEALGMSVRLRVE